MRLCTCGKSKCIYTVQKIFRSDSKGNVSYHLEKNLLNGICRSVHQRARAPLSFNTQRDLDAPDYGSERNILVHTDRLV